MDLAMKSPSGVIHAINHHVGNCAVPECEANLIINDMAHIPDSEKAAYLESNIKDWPLVRKPVTCKNCDPSLRKWASTHTTIRTATSYSVLLTREEMIKVMDNDIHDDTGPQLCELLDSLPGVTDVNYSGHFGAFIFYTVAVEPDCVELRARIEDIIKQYVNL